MPELPFVNPTHLDNRKEGTLASSIFSSNAGIQAITYLFTDPHSYSLGLKYNGATPADVGEFSEFLTSIRYDEAIRQSPPHLGFNIPQDHPVWNLAPDKEFIEQKLTTKNFSSAKWILAQYACPAPRLNIFNISFTIRNVWA